MYRAVELTASDRDLHRFLWRRSPNEPLRDYRMTRVTFGVSTSSFAANMSVKQNALDFALEYPQAVEAVEKTFYVDDGLTGADSVEEATELQGQLQDLFPRGGSCCANGTQVSPPSYSIFLPNSENPNPCSRSNEYTKMLGFEWNANMDHFRLIVTENQHSPH